MRLKWITLAALSKEDVRHMLIRQQSRLKNLWSFLSEARQKNKGKLKNFTRDIVTDSFRQRLMPSKQTVPSVWCFNLV